MARPEVTGRAPAKIAQVPRKKNRRNRGPPTHAFTIQEFCDAHRISRAQFYGLQQRGLAPDVTRLLDKIIITFESAARWRKQRTAASKRSGIAAAMRPSA
jgi:hypothetical protein